jgi:trehalose 6-phosphate phosphatase
MSQPARAHLPEINQRIAAAPHRTLFAGYDGVLTPLVDRPEDAQLAPAVWECLAALAARADWNVVILSGRALEDLRGRADVHGAVHAGNHGLEIAGPGFQFVEPRAEARRSEVSFLVEDLSGRLRDVPGVLIENKGLTLSVHFRLVPKTARAQVRRAVEAALARTAFQQTLGNLVYDIRPPSDWNKGTAARWIEERLGKPDALSISLGDDQTDEDLFRAQADGITIKVGGSSSTRACYHLESVSQVQAFLRWLADPSSQM